MSRHHVPLPYGLHPSAHGGVLRNRSKGRGQRALSLRHCMHLVLRSSMARGAWSFVRGANRAMVNGVLAKHAAATGVELLGTGNAGNHLHLRVKFSSRAQYCSFIRAVAGEIALKLKRVKRTDISTAALTQLLGRSFWDRRPFSSIVSGARYFARLTDYLKINDLEGQGFTRAFAQLTVQRWRDCS